MDTIEKPDSFTVTSLEGLNGIYKKPAATATEKETDYVTAPGAAFIAGSPFLILSTASESGIDCSPKGDAPGFVQLLDDRTLLIPDRPGNNRIDGMKNILANPKVGIIFMAPGANETYRVNGSAKISVDPALLARFEVNGKLPRAVIVVSVEEAFNHCPKALVRARLWDEDSKQSPRKVPTQGEFGAFRDGGDAEYAAKYDAEYAIRIPKELY
ncbi:MAG: MSMEG_1061 family FMN-dependent PPOX-type flavoprotein [Alphaproteobacteria bacterium]